MCAPAVPGAGLDHAAMNVEAQVGDYWNFIQNRQVVCLRVVFKELRLVGCEQHEDIKCSGVEGTRSAQFLSQGRLKVAQFGLALGYWRTTLTDVPSHPAALERQGMLGSQRSSPQATFFLRSGTWRSRLRLLASKRPVRQPHACTRRANPYWSPLVPVWNQASVISKSSS